MLKIKFKNAAHKDFYEAQASKCKSWDVYSQSLLYVLGLSEDCKNHIADIYDYDSGEIRPECLSAGWITSSSRRAILFAFNLYNNFIGADSADSTPASLFCDLNARFFCEAVRIRYPEYTEIVAYDIMDEGGNVLQEDISGRIVAESYCEIMQRQTDQKCNVVEHAEITGTI